MGPFPHDAPPPAIPDRRPVDAFSEVLISQAGVLLHCDFNRAAPHPADPIKCCTST